LLPLPNQAKENSAWLGKRCSRSDLDRRDSDIQFSYNAVTDLYRYLDLTEGFDWLSQDNLLFVDMDIQLGKFGADVSTGD
jgi:hypothetical protein